MNNCIIVLGLPCGLEKYGVANIARINPDRSDDGDTVLGSGLGG